MRVFLSPVDVSFLIEATGQHTITEKGYNSTIVQPNREESLSTPSA
jgi:hypothetical protein